MVITKTPLLKHYYHRQGKALEKQTKTAENTPNTKEFPWKRHQGRSLDQNAKEGKSRALSGSLIQGPLGAEILEIKELDFLIYQKRPFVHNSVCSQFLEAWHFLVLSAGKPRVLQNSFVLVFMGGGGIVQLSPDTIQNGISHTCACVKLSAEEGGVSHHFGGELASPKSIARYEVLQRQYRNIARYPKGSKRCFPQQCFPNGVFRIPHLGSRQRKTPSAGRKMPENTSVLEHFGAFCRCGS